MARFRKRIAEMIRDTACTTDAVPAYAHKDFAKATGHPSSAASLEADPSIPVAAITLLHAAGKAEHITGEELKAVVRAAWLTVFDCCFLDCCNNNMNLFFSQLNYVLSCSKAR